MFGLGIKNLLGDSANLSPEKIKALLGLAGISADFSRVESLDIGPAFIRASSVAVLPGAQVMAIHGQDKEGARIEALLVFAPKD